MQVSGFVVVLGFDSLNQSRAAGAIKLRHNTVIFRAAEGMVGWDSGVVTHPWREQFGQGPGVVLVLD